MTGDSGTTSCAVNVWPLWNSGITTSATSVTTGTPDVWHIWTADNAITVSSTQMTTNSIVWTAWSRSSLTTGVASASMLFPPAVPPHLHAQAIELRARVQEEAKARAHQLLVEHLSPKQRETLAAHGYFDVDISGKTYRIHRGRAQNVYVVDSLGKRVANYCIHPTELVPDEDTMLSQKLLLEANEVEFLRIANRHPC